MEIFNIHLFEFLLIAGLALIIFGPERLPEVGRFLGKQVARFLAWQQQSPELQVINDVRAELDREIASLRDDLMRTRKQLDVSQDMETLRKDLRSMVRLRDEPASAASEVTNTIAPPQAASTLPTPEVVNGVVAPEAATATVAGPAGPAAINGIAAPKEPAIYDLPSPPGPSGTVPMAWPKPPAARTSTAVVNSVDEQTHVSAERRRTLDDGLEPAPAAPEEPPDQPELPAPNGTEQAALLRQIQTLNTDLHALIAELHGRGLIEANWRGAEAEVERTQESCSR